MSCLSPALQGMEKCLQFYLIRQSCWDRLDEHIFERDFNRYWPQLTPEQKQGVLMNSLWDLRLSMCMLPDVPSVPASSVFDLILATRIQRKHWNSAQKECLRQVAKDLIERGSNPNHVGDDPLGTGTFSVLELCLSGAGGASAEVLEWVRLLIDAGANPSMQGHPEHGPPLELALRMSDPGPLLLLLESGADSKAVTSLKERKPAIQCAFAAWQQRKKLDRNLSPVFEGPSRSVPRL